MFQFDFHRKNVKTIDIPEQETEHSVISDGMINASNHLILIGKPITVRTSPVDMDTIYINENGSIFI
jgi:hypothetical protein